MLKRHNVLFVYVGGESPLKVSATYRFIFFLPLARAETRASQAAAAATVLELSVSCCCCQERLAFSHRLPLLLLL